MPRLTNATKANVIAVTNALLVLVTSFGLAISDEQQAAIMGLVNVLAVAWIGATYKQSPKRIQD